MSKVQAWDTNGVTDLGALDDGRIKLEFSGTDGQKRNILIPGASIPHLVASLVAFNAKVSTATGTKDTIAGTHMLGVKSFTVGADESGSDFAVALTTGDGLQLRFLLNTNNAEALATALVATLAEHGRSLPPLSSGGVKH